MIDLHMHSTFSDGLCTPTQLVEGAARVGITAMALTDHDTTAGWHELKRVCQKHHIEPIPAVELGSDYSPGTLHVLGYLVDPGNGVLRQHLDWLRQGRSARNEAIYSRLNMIGLRLRWDEIEKQARGGIVGRLHIAKAMVTRGYVPSVKEAFSQYLGRSRPAYIPRRTLDPAGCIELIHAAGGVAVLAHPYTLDLSAGLMQELLDYLTQAGLDGIEVFYPAHSDRQVQTFIRMAAEFGLVMTGGSDFHDAPDELKYLGLGASEKPIPGSLIESLKMRQADIHG